MVKGEYICQFNLYLFASTNSDVVFSLKHILEIRHTLRKQHNFKIDSSHFTII
jgi:hypothetical protein